MASAGERLGTSWTPGRAAVLVDDSFSIHRLRRLTQIFFTIGCLEVQGLFRPGGIERLWWFDKVLGGGYCKGSFSGGESVGDSR